MHKMFSLDYFFVNLFILLFCILTIVNLPKYIKIFLGCVLNLTVPNDRVVV